MTATAPSTLQRLGLGDFDHEMASTRRILARVPDEHFDWRPHAKSGTRPRGPSYRSYYDDASRERVGELFKLSIEDQGYEF